MPVDAARSAPTESVAAKLRPAARDGVTVDGVTHWFFAGDQARIAVSDVSFTVRDDQFVALVGKSGCGKTTILNMIAGLIKPEAGTVEIRLDSQPLSLPSRQVGYMWARDALLPWRSLHRNVALGLEARGVPKDERAWRADQAITMVGLAGSEHRYPRQLSQGMRQRANLARLLALEPKVFLMDEPFSALDAQTKHRLQSQFAGIWEQERRPVVYVTHDLDEAALLADRILVMSRGRLRFDIPVPFERPRDLDELRYDDRFVEFSRELWHLIGRLEGEQP